MKWSEHMIARAISLQTFSRKCIVLVDNCNWTGYECDVLGITTDLRIIDIEIKISRSDLKADAKKDKWWHTQLSGYETVAEKPDANGYLVPSHQRSVYSKTLREHPIKVWKHYYALPKEIWKPELVDSLPSKSSGILLLSEQSHDKTLIVTCQRRAAPSKDAYRLKPAQAIDIARLANLRMWESYRLLDQSSAKNDVRNVEEAAA